MNTVASLILPVLLLCALFYGAVKKIGLYDCFAEGAKQAFPLVLTIFPYLAAIFVMTELMQASGISDFIVNAMEKPLSYLGVPPELCRLILLKPFSGSGSLALLSEIYAKHGSDSYIARCASCIYGSSETIFYISAVYFSKCKNKKTAKPIIISLVSTFLSCLFACFICRII